MEQDTEYVKLPLEERCTHKLWRARLHGYKECVNIFQCIDDEKSPEWNKFLGFVKKFVVDSNVAAQEKGLEAALAFVENAAVAGKTVGEVMNGIITKCIAAPKAKTKELAIQITLMYIEIEKHEAVQEELLKGTDAKNPKIVAACISILTLALRQFGPKVVNIKPLIKKIPSFLEDRDKTVRDEGKFMVIEIYRWIGAPLKQQLNTLKPVQAAELETEFNNMNEEKVVPIRFLKSQKPKPMRITESVNDANEEGKDITDCTAVSEIDPYELLEPVDILSKLSKNFYDKIDAKKWQERKEALETLEVLVKSPKLESADYGDVVRALKKVISKDTNVLVVALAGKCLTGLASGLKQRFQPYATACLASILEKFREKKQTVVQSLREAVDAIFLSVSIDVILEDTVAALENKNPAVKSETASYLARCFSRTPPPSLNKKLLKAYTIALLKTLNEPDPTVRDSSAEALGTAMKLVGEKAMIPFLTDIDNLKMSKIKECADKAVVHVKIPNVAKSGTERPNTAPSKIESSTKTKDTETKAQKRPNTSTRNKIGAKKASTASLTNIVVPRKPGSQLQAEKNYSTEEIEEMAAQLLPCDILAGLTDTNWKIRLSAVEHLSEFVKQADSGEISTQVIVRTLGKKPGFKDTNFQVLKLRLEIVKYLAESFPFSTTVCEYCVMDITEKLGDAKNSTIAAETLLAIAEVVSLEYIADEIVAFAFNQKNPKVQQETLSLLCRSLMEFGCLVNIKSLIEYIKKAVAATNPGVRTAGITLVGTLYLFMGRPLLMFFENEKPALRQQIEQECEKRNGETPPVPVRGTKCMRDKVCDEGENADTYKKSNNNSEVDINNLIPRVDISNQITEALLNELSDKNWKVRNESLQKLNTIISEAKFVKASIGDLPQGLALRLVDSNSKIAQSALGICQTLAIAMGSSGKQHIRVLFPGFIQCLGDNKTWIRAAAISCINTWGDQCGYKEFFDGEMIGDALKSGSPVLRSEVWNWLAQKLPLIAVKQIPKEELLICLPHLYSNLEDRNSDVRKNAQEAVLGFMIHLSYEAMARNTEKLKPGSRTAVLAALDKSRPNLPVKPLPKKAAPEENNKQKAIKTIGAMKASKAVVKSKQNAQASKPGSARKKDDDVDTSPLLATNNLKHQRVIDEQKLKVLKWNFTTPREEFVDLLKELMTTANVNKTLLANMFHSDFRYHLKAIEALTEDLPDNSKALVSNLDLILKWLTLRFFDTNPSVLLKGLEYLRVVFNLLIENQYHMLENEAASFIPYLIIKIGDPKDAVRNGVRALFKQIALVYPVSKLFSYVMEGLKSKNARQRTECLDQLGSLIENYGLSVCQPSPSIALKEIAKQIADRDNSVRNAALNCIVQAYFLQGERIYKLIGQISEKDQSLLDERIKRAAKNRPTKSANSNMLSTAVSVTPAPSADDIKTEYEEESEETSEAQPSLTPQTQSNESLQITKTEYMTVKDTSTNDEVHETCEINELASKEPPENSIISANDHEDDTKTNSPTSTQPNVSGPFGLDMDLLQRIELNAPVKYKNPVLMEIDLSDFDETLKNIDPAKVTVIPISPPKLLVSKSATGTQQQQQQQNVINTSKEDSLERKILAMSSLDLAVAIQSMNSIDNMIKSHQMFGLQSKEDKFIGSINMQLKLLQTYPLQQGGADISKGFRNTFMVLLTFYDTGILGKNVPLIHLKELVDQMISLLAERKLHHLHQADAYYRVINIIMCKIIDNSNHTTIICVLIKLLHGCAESLTPSKYEELVMKCLWKIVKTIPNWAADLDYDIILLEVHRFLKDYPSIWWKKRKYDTPLRTIKTILHSMTRVKGSTILSHLTRINNTNESELHSYLIRLISTFKPEEMNSSTKSSNKSGSTSKSQEHLSKFTHQQLSEIFKKIGSKEHTQEGLIQLYDFKLQYPEADVQPFLVKSHQFFQDFIEQGLRDIDQARKNQNLISHTDNQYSTDAGESDGLEGKGVKDPFRRPEKLRTSDAQCRATGQPSAT